MCVIVHKERGKDLPSDEVIEKCFKKNPDGSGILLHREGTKLVEIHKGFMKLDDFKTAFRELNVRKEDDLVLHFRIATPRTSFEASLTPNGKALSRAFRFCTWTNGCQI